MPKRKLKLNQKASDDETEIQTPAKRKTKQTQKASDEETEIQTPAERKLKQTRKASDEETEIQTPAKRKRKKSQKALDAETETLLKRKLKLNPKASDNETVIQTTDKQFKKQNVSSAKLSVQNVLSTSKEEHDSSRISNLGNTSGAATDDTHYDSFSSFFRSLSFLCYDSDDECRNSKGTSQNASNKCENSMTDSERGKSHEKDPHPASSSHENMVTEEMETNIRLLPVRSQSCQVALLQHPASLTLHGYVKVAVWSGSIQIFGYNVNEGESIIAFSSEGTGLKKVVTSNPKHKLNKKNLKKKLEKLTCHEEINLEEFMYDVKPSSVVVCVKKMLLPPALEILELYYPTALQTKWFRSEGSEKENFKLCSTEETYTIDVSGDFEMLSTQINEVISNPALSGDTGFGPRILVRGEKNMGKSTLIRYLMNSSLNKVNPVYFLDTDPGQTEYTPPGVVSLFRVTKPLLGPPFAHQKKPLAMIFIGSVTAGTCPNLYEESVKRLMKYFNDEKIKKEDGQILKKTLFINTMGWVQGVGEMCLQNVKNAVKPTIEIELVASDPNLSLTKEVDGNEVTVFKVPSKAPSRERGAPSYSPIEMRNFNLTAYFGQCQKPFLPLSGINSFHPYGVSWDKIALYVMGKKVPAHRLVEAIHCSIVALCRVDSSLVLKSDNPAFPMTLNDEPICECLGFGLVRASDETNRLFYIITPLDLDELKNVNALIKGNIMIPEEILLKQTIKNVPLPFTNHSQMAKTPGLKAVPKRAFRNTLTPNRTH